MALARTNRGSASGSGAARSLTAFTPANGSLLVAIVGGIHNNAADAVAGSSVSGGGLTWTRQAGTQAPDLVFGPVKTFITIWTAPVTTGSSTTISSNNSVASPHGSWLACYEYTGQDASPIGATATGTRTNASGAASITLSAAPASTSEVIAGAGANNWNTADVIQTGTGWTGLVDINDYGAFTEDHAHVQVRSGSTSTTVGWNQLHADPEGASDASGSGVMLALEIKEASGGGGDQSITGALYTDSDTFNANTVGASYGITGALYSDADTFHTATLAASYAVTGGLFSDGDSFYQAAVAPGAVNIAGGLYSDPDSFYGATVTAASGDQTITGALFTDSDTFPAATVGTSYSITGALLSDADTFFASATSATYPVTGGLFTDGDTFQPATLTTAYTVSAGLFSDADTFHAASVLLQQDQAITGTLFANDNSFYQASVGDRTARGGDDAPRRRYPAYVPEVRTEEPVTEPEKPVQKRRVTRKAVKKALETFEIPEILKPTVNKAQKWLPPAIEALDEAEFEAELRKLILEKALRDAEDEDDIELLLWAA